MTMPSSEPFIISRPPPEGGRFAAGMSIAGRYRLERVGRERLKNITEAIEVHRIISPPSRR